MFMAVSIGSVLAEEELGSQRGKTTKIPYRFDFIWRWLKYSGLPEKLGGPDWQLFKELLELEGRYGRGKTIHISYKHLGKMIGRGRDFVRDHSQELAKKGYIDYKPGRWRYSEAEYRIIHPIRTPKSVDEIDWRDGGKRGAPNKQSEEEESKGRIGERVGSAYPLNNIDNKRVVSGSERVVFDAERVGRAYNLENKENKENLGKIKESVVKGEENLTSQRKCSHIRNQLCSKPESFCLDCPFKKNRLSYTG